MNIIFEFLSELFLDRSARHPDREKIESAYAAALLEPESERDSVFKQRLKEDGVKLSESFEMRFQNALQEGQSTSEACAFIR